jgi:pentapeptide MXKDX repeat protein
MAALICLVLAVLTSPFKSRSRLEAENAALLAQSLAAVRTLSTFSEENNSATTVTGGLFTTNSLRRRLSSQTSFERIQTMKSTSRVSLIVSAIVISLGLALAPSAFAQDKMNKDGMAKDGMAKDGMSKDGMSKDGMKKDDAMSKDGMKKDEMKK